MPGDVVDGFLKNEKDLATDFRVNSDVLIRRRRVEVELDVARGQTIVAKSSHPVRQVDNVVAFGIHRPDNIAHRFDRLPGSIGDD